MPRDRVNPADRQLAILAYHKIGEPPRGTWRTWNYVPEETFCTHLELLREAGWPVLGAPQLLAALERPDEPPQRAAILSFDDGFRSMLAVAQPLLERYGHPALLFVPTDFVGGTNGFDMGAEPEEPICTWEELRELERRGVSVQSHGVTHRAFATLGPEELQRELGDSRAALETELGKPVELFAYPYGDGGADGDAVAALLRAAGYRAAFLYKGGVQTLPAEHPFRLKRIAMGPDTDLRSALEKPPR